MDPTCLVTELPRPDGELGPEEQRELFVHDWLGPLLLGSFDLLEAHIAEADRELAGSLKMKWLIQSASHLVDAK